MSNKPVGPMAADRKRHLLPGALLLVSIAGVSPPALASDIADIPMTAARWQTKGNVAFAQDKAGQDILVVTKGYAELKGMDFGNGTIEYDTKFVGSRITGITFRHQGDSADALYFRPSPDCAVSDHCLQYMPTAHQLFEWDLYGQYQARAAIDPHAWNHIKLVVSGGQMQSVVFRSPHTNLSLLTELQASILALRPARTSQHWFQAGLA